MRLKLICNAIFLFLLCSSLLLNAQAPQRMNYQAVIRNNTNALVVNAPVGIRTSIFQGSGNGTEVYREIFNPNPTTNQNGLVTLEIGGGIPVVGNFSQINWANGPYFLKIETDPTGGTNYTVVSNAQLLSVPYALYAGSSVNLPSGSAKGDMLYWDGAQWKRIPAGAPGQILQMGQDNVPTWGVGSTNPSPRTVVLSGRITKDTIFRKGDNNLLRGRVYITNNATLTIEKGAVIKAEFTGSDVGALIIARGAKIVAEGSASEPIVFTSAATTPRAGDWAGIVICGKAKVNSSSAIGGPGTFLVEGGINNAENDGIAGGTDDEDNSGIFRYVRIEYAGYAYQPDQEINSLTMAAVGSKTKIEYVQATYAKDDAFEWFGGTVNCNYLVAYKTQDDDFDSDFGYRGKVQFGLIVRDSLIADISQSNGFESDNDSQGTTNTPQTGAVFSNITAIGPRATQTSLGSNLYNAGAHIRRNSAISIFNSVFMGWPTGILIDGSRGRATDLNIQDSSIRIRNCVIAGYTTDSIRYVANNSSPTGMTTQLLTDWYLTPFYGNRFIKNNNDVRYTRPFDYINPDFIPFATSPLVNSVARAAVTASFGYESKLAGLRPVDFIGGIAAAGELSVWYKGWTVFQ